MYSPTPLLDAAPVWTTDSDLLPSPATICSPDFMPIQRLRSPIHLSESHMTPPPSTFCPRRRSKANTHSPRRRRVPPRVNIRVSAPAHAFDDLPWISTLEAAPELTNPWDIADLSLIPDPPYDSHTSGSGPVRTRKSSLRSSPMDSPTFGSPLPIRDTSRPISVPTPRSHFSPSRVLFHNLMPVPCD